MGEVRFKWDLDGIEMIDFMYYRRKINRKVIVFNVVSGKWNCILEGSKLKEGYSRYLFFDYVDKGFEKVFVFWFLFIWKGF